MWGHESRGGCRQDQHVKMSGCRSERPHLFDIDTFTHTGAFVLQTHPQPRKHGTQKQLMRFDSTLIVSQSALFNFQSLLLVLLLFICTSAYTHYVFPAIMDRNKDGYVTSPTCVGLLSWTYCQCDGCLLESSKNRRALESVCQHLLRRHGRKSFST